MKQLSLHPQTLIHAMQNNHLTLYVYYKIPADKQNTCLLAVKNLQQKIISYYPNVKVQHQKRPGVDLENKETWMETYTNIPNIPLEKFTAELSDFAKKSGLPTERKYEVFMPLETA